MDSDYEFKIPPDVPTDPVEYDAWFRAKVQEALADPRPGIPHEEVEARMAKRRAAALKKLRDNPNT